MKQSRITIQLHSRDQKKQTDKPEQNRKVDNPGAPGQDKKIEPIYAGEETKNRVPTIRRHHRHHRNKRRGFNHWKQSVWFRIGAPVVSATLIGVVFGFVVLAVFVNPEWDPENMMEGTQRNINAVSGTPSGGQDVEAESDNTGQTAMGGTEPADPDTQIRAVSMQIPSATFFMVQAGVFGDRAGAEKSVQTFGEKGWPSVVMAQDQYHVFLSTALNRESALAMGSYFQQQDVVIYVKEWVVPSFNGTVTLKGGTEGLEGFLDEGRQLFDRLSASTSNVMTSSTEPDQTEWKKIQDHHRNMIDYRRQLKFDSSLDDLAARMEKNLTAAVSALDQYRKQKNQSYLWQTQQNLLQYVKDYQVFLTELSADSPSAG
ncbi:MAG: hypothetical protein H0Z33_11715 [Bacillaceae bacterium]|nr:hypothetical protein [Bacillaceae bacterium]